MISQIQQIKFRKPAAAILFVAGLLVLPCAGCSANRSVWRNALFHAQSPVISKDSCADDSMLLPSCSAPQSVVGEEQSGVSAPVQTVGPVPMLISDNASVGTQPFSGCMPVPPATVPEIPVPAMSELSVSKEELAQCQQQLSALNERFNQLQVSHQHGRKSLVILLAEQQRLKHDNERLQQELDSNYAAEIATLDSLSRIIEEVVVTPTSAASGNPAPAAAGELDDRSVAIPGSALPAVDGAP